MNTGLLIAAVFGIAASFAGFASCDVKTGNEVLVAGPSKVFFICSPMIDLYASVDQSVVDELQHEKGTSQAVTHETFEQLGERVHVVASNAGGSSANTSRAFAFLGGDATYCGAVGEDEDGKAFEACLSEYGVNMDWLVSREVGRTNRTYCLITPDGERTMYILRGVAGGLSLADVPPAIISGYDYFALNAFSFGTEERAELSKTMAWQALQMEKGIITLLANMWPVKTKKDLIRPIADESSFISGTLEEYKHLYDIEDKEELFKSFEKKTVGHEAQHKAVIITMGREGAMVIYQGGRYFVEPAAPESEVLNTTGAGDFFAGAMLYGLLNGYSVKTSSEFARVLVGDIITKMGTLLDDGLRDKVNAIKAGAHRA